MTTQPESDTCHKPLSVAQAVVMVVAGVTYVLCLDCTLYQLEDGRQRQRIRGFAPASAGRGRLRRGTHNGCNGDQQSLAETDMKRKRPRGCALVESSTSRARARI